MTKTFATAALAIAAVAMPLSVAHASEGRNVTVSYADLDLSSKAGQQIFDRRIERAIESVCGRMTGRPTFDASTRDCQLETQAVAKSSRDVAVANYGNASLAAGERKIRFAAN